MTYKEFKKEIEKLGLKYRYDNCFVSIYHLAYRRYPLAYVSEETLNRMMITSGISVLTPITSSRLLTLCYELAQTPLHKRGELE